MGTITISGKRKDGTIRVIRSNYEVKDPKTLMQDIDGAKCVHTNVHIK